MVHTNVSFVSRARRGRVLAATLAFVLAVAGALSLQLSSGSMSASANGGPSLSLEAWWHSSDGYKGVAVNVSATSVPDDAKQLRITVHRAAGGDVVKTSKTTGSVIASVKTGSQVTAPIVIQPGDYNESESGSWNAPSAVWSAATIPTSVTVDLLAGETVLATADLAISSFGGVTADDVMPLEMTLEVQAYWMSGPLYIGAEVAIRAANVPDGVTQVRVTTHRAAGGDVVKTSKLTGSVVSILKAGDWVSAPVIIQTGTYVEANSSSWSAPVAVWAPNMIPTSATVEVLAGDSVIASAQTAVVNQGDLTAADVMPLETPPVVVTVPSSGPSYTVDVPAGADEVILELGAPSGPDDAVVIPIEVTVETQVGASVVFPAGASVTSTDSSWDGKIQLPKVKTGVVVPTTPGQNATVAVAIELGSPTARIDFDTPVKLVLAGQAGQSAAYIQGGTFHAITEACPVTVPSGMTTDECWVNEGGDLVIWTTHFTTFVAYSISAELAATGAADLSLTLFLALGAAGLGAVFIVGSRTRRAERN